jgi:UDP-glucose 4-epimerase
VRSPSYWRNNALGSLQLIDASLDHGVRAFVFSSTAAVYGLPEFQPIPEASPLAPINPYGASKAAVEQILADVERAHGLRWAALRYFNACGADPAGGLGECHEPETHLIPVASRRPRGCLSCSVRHRYPTRDGTCLAIRARLGPGGRTGAPDAFEGGPGGPYNLGTGRGQSIREVLDAVATVVGRPVPWRAGSPREGDPAELVADASRFRRDFGWEPVRSDLDTILRTAWGWLRSSKGLPDFT